MVKNVTAEQIIDLRKLDYTWKQIALTLDISEMTILRRLKDFNEYSQYNLGKITNILKKKFNFVLKKSLISMTASELRIIYALYSGNNISLTKKQYINRIKKWC